jgi:predicted DNA-binding protein YlxM (UPF0122 family)
MKILSSYLEGNYSQEKISEMFGVSRTFLTDVLKICSQGRYKSFRIKVLLAIS